MSRALLPQNRCSAFTLIELLVVIGIISILLVAMLPAVNSLSKSNGRKAAIGNLLGILEQARVQAVRDGQPTYVVFPDQLPGNASAEMVSRYAYHSYAIFQDDPANPGTQKQLTPWRTLPTGVSIRSRNLGDLATGTTFNFTPTNGSAKFPFLKFNAQGEVEDPVATPTSPPGIIQLGVFEGSVLNGTDAVTSSNKNLTETIAIARLTGRASAAP